MNKQLEELKKLNVKLKNNLLDFEIEYDEIKKQNLYDKFEDSILYLASLLGTYDYGLYIREANKLLKREKQTNTNLINKLEKLEFKDMINSERQWRSITGPVITYPIIVKENTILVFETNSIILQNKPLPNGKNKMKTIKLYDYYFDGWYGKSFKKYIYNLEKSTNKKKDTIKIFQEFINRANKEIEQTDISCYDYATDKGKYLEERKILEDNT